MPIFYPQVYPHNIAGNTAGATANISTGTYQLAGGNNIELSQNANTVTIRYKPSQLSFWQNQEGGASATNLALNKGLLMIPTDIGENVFAGEMTANTLLLDLSFISNYSGGWSFTMEAGIYTIYNSTNLSLINSASSTWNMSANANNTNSFFGARWLSFHSSQFSTVPSFSQGATYVFGVIGNLSVTGLSGPGLRIIGQSFFGSGTRSGTFNQVSSTNLTLGWGMPYYGIYSATTTALPGTIAFSEIQKAGTVGGVAGNFIPHIVIDNLTSII